jgi:serine/threonine protein kinase
MKYEKPSSLGDIFPCISSSGALDLLSKLFNIDPIKRIDVKEALNHSFFNETEPFFNSESILKRNRAKGEMIREECD